MGSIEYTEGRHIISIVDYESRWSRAFLTHYITARNIIKNLEKLFQWFGNSDEVISDSGSKLTSRGF